MRRRSASATLLLALLATTASGCSDDGDGEQAAPSPSSSSPSPVATSATPSASASPSAAPPSSASGVLSTAEAVAASRRLGPLINLQAADLPGLTGAPADDDDDSDGPPAAALAKTAACLRLTAEETKDLLDDDEDDGTSTPSQEFTRGDGVPSLEISSEVDVSDEGGVNDPKFARRFGVLYTPRGATCVGELFATTFAGEIPGSTARVTSSRPITVPVRPGQQAGGISTKLVVTVQGQPVPFDIVLANIFQGDVAVTLQSFGAGAELPAAQRTALLTTLGNRLAEAS